jgi:small subunit ribosomal protein S6
MALSHSPPSPTVPIHRRPATPGLGRTLAGRLPGAGGSRDGRLIPAGPPSRRNQGPSGEQRGQPSHVSPSHPAQKRQVAACPPPVHVTLRAGATRVRPQTGAEAAAIVPRSMARFYDLMVLYDPTAPDERQAAAMSEVESLIGSGGELVESYDWGTRRMAYEIDHRPEAEYRLYQFRGDNALLERLNQRLRILDGVLRFRIIKIRPGMPTPPPPEHQAARRREEREPQDTRVAARAAADAPAGE